MIALQKIFILTALSIAVGFRASELAPIFKKPNGDWNSGNVKAFCTGSSKEIYYSFLKDKTMAQRIAGVFLSARLVNILGGMKDNSVIVDKYQGAVGVWFFLWFAIACLILWRYGPAVWLMLFAGVIASSLFAAHSWETQAYPWDMPALAFAALFLVCRRPWLLLIALAAGMFFKETCIVFSILFLFWPGWGWKNRIVWFVVAGTVCISIKMFISFVMFHTIWLAATQYSGSNDSNVYRNLCCLFSIRPDNPIFIGAGLIFVWLLSKPELKYVLIFIVFSIGIFMCGNIMEMRVFNEMLPIAILGIFKGTKNARSQVVFAGSGGAAADCS